MRHRCVPAILLVSLFVIGCNVIPRDSAGTLERVRGGELRVGVAHHPPWVHVEGDQVTGIEPELIETWAQQLGARVRWLPGSEAELVEALHHRDADVLVAGLRSDSPYGPQLALTQPYLELEDRYGSGRHVLAVMPGESALLLSLDRFLAAQDKAALLRRARQDGRLVGGQQ